MFSHIYFTSFICVIMLVIGQLLFKYSAISANVSGSFLNFPTIIILIVGFFIYGIASILWLIVLKQIDLGKIYPIMAFSFIITPLGSHILFNEQFTPNYIIGSFIIFIGIIIIFKN